MALEVLKSGSVDGQTWSEAVKWLLLFGPPEIRDMIQLASGVAFQEYFPGLEPAGYDEEGSPCYEIKDIAEALGISEEEIQEELVGVEREYEVSNIILKTDPRKIQ